MCTMIHLNPKKNPKLQKGRSYFLFENKILMGELEHYSMTFYIDVSIQ